MEVCYRGRRAMESVRGQRRGAESNRHAIKSTLARRLQMVAFWFTEVSDEGLRLGSMEGLTRFVPFDLTIRPRVLSDTETVRLGKQASGTTHGTSPRGENFGPKRDRFINGGSLTISVVLEKEPQDRT